MLPAESVQAIQGDAKPSRGCAERVNALTEGMGLTYDNLFAAATVCVGITVQKGKEFELAGNRHI